MRHLFIYLILTVSCLLPTVNCFAQVITTMAGGGNCSGPFFCGDGGQATAAKLYGPDGIIFDATGNMYIADVYNNRIRKIDVGGIITTIAGNDTAGYSGDGGPATLAKLYSPAGLAFDAIGNLYIADNGNGSVRKITISTGIISTVAGNGTGGYGGDGGPATLATLSAITGVSFDAAGNMYIADYNNNRVRKVDMSGIITTIAGTGTVGFSGDGGLATSAKLSFPASVTFDVLGDLYITDSDNHRIRKVDASGIITTVAGGGTGGLGDGGPATAARLYYPSQVIFDPSGNMYIADVWNRRIRKVDVSGIITTIVGNGIKGCIGDGGLATAAELNYTDGITFDSIGNLYISDNSCNTIRKVTNVAQIGIQQITGENMQIEVYPNPATGIINIELNTPNGFYDIKITDLLSNTVYKSSIQNEHHLVIDINSLRNGVYFIELKSKHRTLLKKIIKN